MPHLHTLFSGSGKHKRQDLLAFVHSASGSSHVMEVSQEHGATPLPDGLLDSQDPEASRYPPLFIQFFSNLHLSLSLNPSHKPQTTNHSKHNTTVGSLGTLCGLQWRHAPHTQFARPQPWSCKTLPGQGRARPRMCGGNEQQQGTLKTEGMAP